MLVVNLNLKLQATLLYPILLIEPNGDLGLPSRRYTNIDADESIDQALNRVDLSTVVTSLPFNATENN